MGSRIDESKKMPCDLIIKVIKILRDYKVSACQYGSIEVEFWSPDGEDMPISLFGDSLEQLAQCAKDQWEEFDADDHAAQIYHAKHYGSDEERRFFAAASDSLEDLVADAKAIKKTYERIYKALDAAARRSSKKSKKSKQSKK